MTLFTIGLFIYMIIPSLILSAIGIRLWLIPFSKKHYWRNSLLAAVTTACLIILGIHYNIDVSSKLGSDGLIQKFGVTTGLVVLLPGLTLLSAGLARTITHRVMQRSQ